jgi:hypothetical protein
VAPSPQAGRAVSFLKEKWFNQNWSQKFKRWCLRGYQLVRWIKPKKFILTDFTKNLAIAAHNFFALRPNHGGFYCVLLEQTKCDRPTWFGPDGAITLILDTCKIKQERSHKNTKK